MNDLKVLIQETYRETIKNGDYPPDLKKFLQTHERKFLFFDNLCREFNSPKILKRLTRDKVVYMTKQMTHVFVMSAKRRADELNMSKIEQGLLKQKASQAQDMKRLSEKMDSLEKTNVTQDEKGNETTKSEIQINESFV